jgi:hypothetical protein
MAAGKDSTLTLLGTMLGDVSHAFITTTGPTTVSLPEGCSCAEVVDTEAEPPRSLWVYRKTPILLPAQGSFAIKLSFGECGGSGPTPTEQFVLGTTCEECGAVHGACVGHPFKEREEDE